MKLGKYLIVTVSDFARHFTFQDFWENRKQFVRDMHPDKVYYWNEELKQAYFDVADWINQGESAKHSIINSAIKALSVLIDRPIRTEEVELYNSIPDLTSPIIRVLAGTLLDLPKYTDEKVDTINLRYHKIEVYGNSNKPAVIKIGSRDSITLYASEFTYVTEVDKLFIEFLPTRMQNNIYDLSLISEEGAFFSTLNVRTLFTGNQMVYRDVISFALTNDGYIFINSFGNPIIMSRAINELKFMLKYNGKAFYVKAKGSQAVILYNDGTLRATYENATSGKVVCVEV